MKKNVLWLVLALTCVINMHAQDVSLFQQFNGRYDFTFIGNTLNTQENGDLFATCEITTSSSAALFLDPSNTIEKAYLYWAGSGPGDFEVTLNGIAITPSRTFNVIQPNGNNGLIFFSAFADITSQVVSTGNSTYLLENLDLTNVIADYCPNRTNFGGWAIVVIYSNDDLPLNQLNVYDGLQFVSATQTQLNISLNSLNVIDNEGARIGFLAWEGDKGIAVNETLTINGNIISNPPLNPANNAFNGTNSFTGEETLYNMDLDVYNIQNNIQIGDTSAEIQMTSGQDFVMINAIITKLNSQLPDATVSIDNVQMQCNSRVLIVDYTVYNVNSTDELPSGVPIAIYADGLFIQYTETIAPIPIGGSQSDQISLVIPDSLPPTFTLTFVVDDDGSGTGIITELNEQNNSFSIEISLLLPPQYNIPPDPQACNLGFGAGVFDFSNYPELIAIDPVHTITFHETQADAENGTNQILNTSNYPVQTSPKEIFIRVFDGTCFSVFSMLLKVRNCPPIIYNYISANYDGTNDNFYIKGLRDIFLNFELEVYNRWGVLLWTGNNNTPNWDGKATRGMIVSGNNVPDGTYYYVLKLNDPDYPDPFTGFLYLNR